MVMYSISEYRPLVSVYVGGIPNWQNEAEGFPHVNKLFSMTAVGSDKLLRILCIHGYRQNAQLFREKSGSLRKMLKKHAELVYITAPNIVPPMENAESDPPQPDQRGWWFSRKDDFFHARDPSDLCKGYDLSLKVITDAFREQGPFDGVLGFSQGAALLSLLCASLQQQGKECPFQFDFAIIIAGFESQSSQHSPLYDVTVTMPTLHVFGDTDRVIGNGMSETLLTHYEAPQVLRHAGGHFIPASSPHRPVYTSFLDSMRQQKTASQAS